MNRRQAIKTFVTASACSWATARSLKTTARSWLADTGWSSTIAYSTAAKSPWSIGPAKPVTIELDQSKRDYLHIVAGTAGSEFGAGLFTARA